MSFAIGLGPNLATSIFLAYLAADIFGLPVFSGLPEFGIGPTYLAGPTGGYLVGLLIASWVTGTMPEGRGTICRIGAMLVGLAITHGIGVAWLANYVPLDRLWSDGLAPFMLGDLLKVGIIAAAASVAQQAASPESETYD